MDKMPLVVALVFVAAIGSGLVCGIFFAFSQAAGFFHCIGIGLRDGRQELGSELQTFAIANAAEARVRAWGGV